jgi:hypothetical protein
MIRIKYRLKISILLKYQYARQFRYEISKLQVGTLVNEYCKYIKEYVNNKLSEKSNVVQQ